jgi:uncharacterized membrane protein YhaH (DUF805 family)
MIKILKKYWLLSLIIFIVINILGFYLMKESLGISDSLEHVESDEVVASLKRKNFFCKWLINFIFIIDVCLILSFLYLIIKNIFKKLNLSKK